MTNKFHELVISHRLKKGIGQTELADLIKDDEESVSRQSINAIERKRVLNPRLESTVLPLARELDIDLNKLK